MMGGGAAASQAYGEAWYWDERYRKEAGPFDWYQKYPTLAPLLCLYVAPAPPPPPCRLRKLRLWNTRFYYVRPKFSRECNSDVRRGQQNPQGEGCLHSDYLWRSKLPIVSPEGHAKLDDKASCHRWERSSNQNKWELTKALPLDDYSTSVVAALGPKPDVHYIYVYIKGNCGARVNSKVEEAAN
ncbi:hypothetical protein ACP70R_000212 [Stipagrostis hirtigluma subsp. patula]